MTRTVYLHIGAPKTGTTYLQDRLTLNATSLADHDVHFPTRSPMVSPGLFQFRAALDLLGQDWGGPRGHAEGNWEALVRRIRRRSGSVIVSHEILAPARPDAVARAMTDLQGSDVHVVYTARDLARQLPAAWQESIKQGRKWRFARFLQKARQGRTWFSRAFEIPSVLGTWGTHVPPENIHLVTVPQRRAAAGEDPLWDRFCEATGIDPAWAPEQSHRANESLGVAEVSVLRGLNKRLDRQTRREAPYDALIREMLAEQELVGRDSRRITLPPGDRDWVEERTGRWLEWVEQSGIHVVGDVEDLRPTWPAEDEKWHDPDGVKPRKRLAVAMDALAAMTAEAASRPDPERHLTGKLRRNADRLRPR
ncbi:hypothetical protein [Nocardioides coralli]|uniref:hypothetical protein n=1 Tax=Nocardioides coralli TaxID=2872154 RepID=UPI001CA41E5A|nr:hypothetical protein [Nocardioides coralli]QZY29243.1 hypothetical protein K6T13_00500 [Nocardioides coralli]